MFNGFCEDLGGLELTSGFVGSGMIVRLLGYSGTSI